MEPIIFPSVQIFPGEQNTKLVVTLPDGTKRKVIVSNAIYKKHILPMEEFRESIEYMLQHGKDE